jgi:hypothetical protein
MHQRGLLDWPGSPRAQYHKANVLKARDSVFARRGSDLVALDTVGNSAAVRRVRSCPSTPRHNPPFWSRLFDAETADRAPGSMPPWTSKTKSQWCKTPCAYCLIDRFGLAIQGRICAAKVVAEHPPGGIQFHPTTGRLRDVE